MGTNKRGSRSWQFQWPLSFTGMNAGKAGLAGIGFLAGILLLGSWNMPFHSQAAISQAADPASVGSPPIWIKEDLLTLPRR